MSAHSEKGLKTIELMNTTAAQWALTPIKWVEEIRTIPQEKTCPTCQGDRSILKDEAGVQIPRPARVAYPDAETIDWTDEAAGQLAYDAVWADYKAYTAALEAYNVLLRKEHSGFAYNGNCPRCIKKRGYCTGRAMVPTPTKVMVGYPQWLEGLRFDSRFGVITTDRYCCALCSKTISKSGMVPVQARGDDGKAHGMWVGTDCAKKIFGLSQKLKKDQMIEVPAIQTAA